DDIEPGILVLEDNPDDTVTINSIFRAFHTFKGGAGFLRLEALRDLAHDLESLLDAVRRGALPITSGIIDLILAGSDALKHFTREIGAQLQGASPGAPILVPTRQILLRVQSVLRGERTSAAAPEASSPDGANDAGSAQEASQPETAAKFGPTRAGARRAVAAPGPWSAFVKLDTAKLDSLVDIVGELVIAQSM